MWMPRICQPPNSSILCSAYEESSGKKCDRCSEFLDTHIFLRELVSLKRSIILLIVLDVILVAWIYMH